MKRILIVLLAALLAVSAGAALAAGRHHAGHGHRAAAGRCYRADGGYCRFDGACDHARDACHAFADADGDGVCDRCGTHWAEESGVWRGHGYVDEHGDGVCDRCPAPQTARFAGHHGCCR